MVSIIIGGKSMSMAIVREDGSVRVIWLRLRIVVVSTSQRWVLLSSHRYRNYISTAEKKINILTCGCGCG